jgi:hypothetical protein
MLNGHFMEATTNTINLPDLSPLAFGLFVKWLFHMPLVTPGEGYLEGGAQPAPFDHLVDLYIFADKVAIPDLQNAAIDDMIDRFDNNMDYYRDVKKVWDNTPPRSRLRKLLVAMWAAKPDQLQARLMCDAPMLLQCSEFFMALTMKINANALNNVSLDHGKVGRDVRGKCRFHLHRRGERCQ